MNESTLVPREEMSDLDWLARNVHHWDSDHARTISYSTEFGAERYGDGLPYPKHTKAQWLARRAELQNKPSWGSIGSDINFISQHEDGQWIGHSEKPDEGDECFECDCIISLFGYGEVLGDWCDTLEKRPEQTIADVCSEVTEENRHKDVFEPFFSVEDAATAKQPAPKGSGNPILGMVLADLTNRALEGKEKYGEPLLAYNGRNPLWDAYQEALDLAMYLRQAIEEQK